MLLEIGRRFIVVRGESGFTAGDRLPIVLAHGRAFGSGEHETTSSCLEELEDIPPSRSFSVLDLGSGTGILAIAAARLGAGTVVALDPSPDAFKTTLATVRLNGLEKTVVPVQGEIGALGAELFDLVIANLYGDVLFRLGGDIAAKLKPGGYLLVSGILDEYAYDVRNRFLAAGCTVLKERYLGEYWTFVLRQGIGAGPHD